LTRRRSSGVISGIAPVHAYVDVFLEQFWLQELDCNALCSLPSNYASFADAYDLFAVNFVNILIAYVYYPGSGGVLPPNVDVAIKMASSVGTVMGQIGFGVMNDIYGRKKVSLPQTPLPRF
jgi:hypothetical protein